jgi:hypothetical protein
MADDKPDKLPTPGPAGAAEEPGADDDTRRIAAEPDPSPAPRPGTDLPPAPEKPRLRARSVGVPVAAALAAGLVVVSGLGGYALGATTSGGDLDRVSFQRGGFPPGGPDGWGDRDGDGYGHGRGLPPGPPPGFLDRDGDGPDGSDDADGPGDGDAQGSGATT